MAGEHLPLSNYDSLSVEEICSKLDILNTSLTGSVDFDAVREYEEARPDGARDAVIQKLNELSKGAPAPPPETSNDEEPEPAAPIAEDGPDERQQAATEPTSESTARRKT